MSRRRFLALGGAGLAGVMVLGASSRCNRAETATSLGILPGDRSKAKQNREKLKSTLGGRPEAPNTRLVEFPPGDYYVDNSAPQIAIGHFGGTLRMQPGARFVFTSPTHHGLDFYYGAGARFEGLCATYETTPSTRNYHGANMSFRETSGTVVRNANLEGASAAGLYFSGCVDPSVVADEGRRTRIRDTRADGVHFANCQNPTVRRLYTENTGDDGLAFLSTNEVDPSGAGGYAYDVTVKNSRARGIAVVGQGGVRVEKFVVDGTSVSGLLCCYEAPILAPDDYRPHEYYKYVTKVPSNVVFEDGTVTNGGAFRGTPGWPGQGAPRFGIEVDAVDSVELRNIGVISPGTRGVSSVATRRTVRTPAKRGSAPTEGTHQTQGVVRLTNILVQGAKSAGFDLQGTPREAFSAGGAYYLRNLTAEDAGTTGFYIARGGSAAYDRLTASGASKVLRSGHKRRAFAFENNGHVGPAVAGGTQELRVVDERSVHTDHKVETRGVQSGSMGRIHDGVVNGAVRVYNASNLAYEIVVP